MTAIEWTEETLNPWTGCSKVSPACGHCYIERQPPMRIAGRRFERGEIPLRFHLERLEQPRRRRKPTMYFVCSMSDTFHEDVPDAYIAQLWSMMASCPQHTFQVLTKRIERARDLVPQLALRNGRELPNVWLGVTIENRRWIHRADLLRQTPAAVRFISAEPLLGPMYRRLESKIGRAHDLDLTGIDWLIVGGESGPHARPMREEWVRDLRDATRWPCNCCGPGLGQEHAPECDSRHGDTAFFFKQHGGRTPKAGGRVLDGLEWSEFPRTNTVVTSGV